MERLSFLIVMLAALVIPIAMARFKIASVPTAVAEIVTGIIIGKSVFGWVNPTQGLNMMATLGTMMLMFLSGMEINFDLFKRQAGAAPNPKSPVNLAMQAFGLVFITAAVLGVILKWLGLFNDIFLTTILFSTVALDVVIATLKEKEILGRPAGQTILLTAVLGEVVPMLSLTVYASINGGNASRLWLIVLLFLAAIFLLRRFKQPFIWFNKISKATTQLDIRLAFFLIFTLVAIAERVGAENILGAFLAGMVMKLLEPSEDTQQKLTSIGYGFLIPFFFIMTGVKLDIKQLFANPRALALIPVLVAGFILAKMPTVLIFSRRFSKRNSFAGGFLTVTTITLVLPSLQVARNLHAITSTQSDAFILAAVIVCILGPIVFNSVYKLGPADMIKQRVVILGANTATVPVEQQLSKNWYVVRMVSDSQDNYKTYNSEVRDLTYLEKVDETTLDEHDFFDTDILVAAFKDDRKNAKLARIAKRHGVTRVIASQQNPKTDHRRIDELTAQGIEIYNIFNVQISVMRAMIKSPSIVEMLTDTEAGLFEATVRNRRYTGQELHSLPFIDRITVSRIYRNHKPISPHGDTIIELGDHILFTGNHTDAEEVRAQLRRKN